MKSLIVGVGLVLGAGTLGLSLVGCGSDAPSSGSTPVVNMGGTNFVTIPPVAQTPPPVTTAPDQPGSILAFETEYTVLENEYPSTVAAKWKVPFQEFLDINGFTLDENQFVPEWSGAGQVVIIPAGATVPGEPVTTVGTTNPDASGSTDTATTQARETEETDPPETDPPTTESDCTVGKHTIEEGDYPGLVAKKYDVTVGALNAANQNTKYYSSFAVGIDIVIPC